MRLTGKTALVTGSSRGIGRLIAEALAKEGCRVFVHGRTLEACGPTLALVRKAGGQGRGFAAELDIPSQVDALAAGILKEGASTSSTTTPPS